MGGIALLRNLSCLFSHTSISQKFICVGVAHAILFLGDSYASFLLLFLLFSPSMFYSICFCFGVLKFGPYSRLLLLLQFYMSMSVGHFLET